MTWWRSASERRSASGRELSTEERFRRAPLLPRTTVRLVRLAHPMEQGNECGEFRRREVPELVSMAGANRFGNPLQEFCAQRCNADPDGPPIVLLPNSPDELPFFQSVQHPADIRRPGYHSRNQTCSRRRLWMICVQEPEQIVLLRRQLELAEDGILKGSKPVVRAPEPEKCFLFLRVETARRWQLHHDHRTCSLFQQILFKQ